MDDVDANTLSCDIFFSHYNAQEYIYKDKWQINNFIYNLRFFLHMHITLDA